MPSVRRKLSHFPYLILGSVATFFSSSVLQAQVPPQGIFTATEACPATQAIRGGNPGNAKLAVGIEYEAVGFNSPKREYVLLRLPGVTPEQRWVNAKCGTFKASSEAPDSPPDTPDTPDTPDAPDNGVPRGKVTLYPFFNTEDDRVPVNFPKGAQKDMSPAQPQLEKFDYKILALCGANFNDPVSPVEFRRLMTYYPDVVSKLRQVTNGELKPGRNSEAQFLDDLTEIWFKYNGFKHIFCGEKDGNSIGGLHFYGRYIEFQQKGIAGRIARTSNGQDAKEEVVDGVIYSLGVAIVNGARLVAEHPIKGYPYVLNAQEMLIQATSAFKQFKTNSKESVGCLFTIKDPQAEPFIAVFVKKDGAIRTFYPDATPDTQRNKPCGS
ncbi:MAG TPA: EndoU domain-containing protein [Leptolyngbyaceae cyanobacterium M33_DOE_097]|uniref:Bacterial EndoU nuclease domain-containing protein n=1 Tax=Oscillatoriales cyanobacterium SpSt-418 TaxID=2282169 RepID=A0A7C3PCN8_9CYAN|nr:EndoU domain-containing protein [Leptolyngbyaceae cyanobacterium M33_DOE_097]